MKLLCLSFLIIGVNSFYIDNSPDERKRDRIVGGRNATIESLPFQAQLLQNGIQICGATIISERWILTAAHCIVGSTPKWSIITGSANVSTGGEHHEINKVIVHTEYDEDTNDNDIALIQLEKPIVYNERQKSIPLTTRLPKTGDKMTISGFGKQGENLGYSSFLETANVPVVDHETCRLRYDEDPITDNMFCAGTATTDACQGDSGGPGVINGELAGVVSAGMECASDYFPGIYTNVYKYRNWIAKQIQGVTRPHVSSIIQPSQTILGRIVNKFINLI